MKGNYIKYLLLCLLPLALLSCIKETPESPAVESVNTIPYSVTVSQSPLTRVALRETEFADDCYIFEPDDKLYVEHRDGETLKLYGVLELVSGVRTGTGRFEGELKCLNGFVPEDNTLLNATVVGANADEEFFNFGNPTDDPVDYGAIVTGVTYPSSVTYTSLPELVQKYSYFTGSSTFAAKHFNNLTQQSVFLQFNLANFRKNGLADPSASTANILIKKGSETLHTVTDVPIGDSEYYGNAVFSTVVQAGDALAGAQIQIDDNLEDSNDPLVLKQGFSDDLNLETNHYYSVSRILDCFRIKATIKETTVTFGLPESIEYSDDRGESWHTYTAGKQFTLKNAGDEVWFRGGRATCDCNGETQLFTANKVCYIAGDITALLADPSTLPAYAFRSAFSKAAFSLDTNNPGKVTWVDIDPDDPLILPASTSEYCYAEMFRNCNSLTCAPELPATVLEARCYFRMFSGCSKLTTPPATLPATTIKAQCYYQMFDACTSLEFTPSFPGEKGVLSGTQNYYQMFNDCTALSVTSGKLFTEDTKLTEECFHGMFRHCTALVTVPGDFLPSMLMAKWCYRGLFEGAAFTEGPELPATKLENECYRYLFNSCKNLIKIKCNAANPNNGSFTTNWTAGGLPSGGTFYKNSVTQDNKGSNSTKWPRNGHGIPSGWTVEDL